VPPSRIFLANAFSGTIAMNTPPATPSPGKDPAAAADAAPSGAEGGKSGEGSASALAEMKAMQKTRSDLKPGDDAQTLPEDPAA
jgi:hypothetical protein